MKLRGGPSMKNVVASALVVAVAACTTTTSGRAFQSENTLRIGAMWAITGGVALTGKGALNLSKLAVEEINAAGGIKVGGKQVKLNFLPTTKLAKSRRA